MALAMSSPTPVSELAEMVATFLISSFDEIILERGWATLLAYFGLESKLKAEHRRSAGIDTRTGQVHRAGFVSMMSERCSLTDPADRAFVRNILFRDDYELFRSFCFGGTDIFPARTVT